jgi:hypothetical protein
MNSDPHCQIKPSNDPTSPNQFYVLVFQHNDKISLDNQHIRKKDLFLAYCFRGFSSWLLGSMALNLWKGRHDGRKSVGEQSCSPNGGQEAKTEEGPRSQYPFQRDTPNDLTSFHWASPPKGSATPHSTTGWQQSL